MKILIEITKTGLSAFSPELEGWFTVGKDFEDVKKNVKEAVSLHLDGMRSDNEVIPRKFKGEIEFDFRLDIEDYLTRIDELINISVLSRISGVNRSLISDYKNGKRFPSFEQAMRIIEGLRKITDRTLAIKQELSVI